MPQKTAPARMPTSALVHSESPEEVLLAAAAEDLDETLALTLLRRRDLHSQALEAIAKNRNAAKHRKVQTALAQHPKTPRHISLPTVRRMFTFDLMQLVLTPTTAADVKLAAEEVIVGRFESLSSGERLTLAKNGSGAIASALLLDKWDRVIEAALENPRLTEQWIIKALGADKAPELLIDRVARHKKWSLRREVQLALLKNPQTPMARVLQLCPVVPVRELQELLRTARLSPEVQSYLEKYVAAKG